MAISEVLWDEDGNFLGRDFKSWAKILGFYAVYYSFLGCLFYGFTITYYLESKVLTASPVGGKPAVANPRLDMPGAVVHPFKEMSEARGDVNRMSMDADTIEDYCGKLGAFFEGKKTLNENAKAADCSEDGSNTSNAVCKVNTGDLSVTKCAKHMAKKQPMFTIDINKIIGWSPNNVGIHFNCYEYNKETALKLEKQEYEIKFEEVASSIPSHFFPYNGVSKDQLIRLPIGQQKHGNKDQSEPCETDQCVNNLPFNKPFVAGIIQKSESEGLDDKEHMFRCDILSDKITQQQYSKKEADVARDKELRGLGLGFVEFGFQFK